MTWEKFEKLSSGKKRGSVVYPSFSLADHDKHYHKGKWSPGERCTLRDTIAKKDKSDKLPTSAEHKKQAREVEPESEEMKTKSPNVRTVDALRRLATAWHKGAYRRGKDHLDYIVHPTAVVDTLKSWGYTEEDDPVTLAVGWGHDLIEDTKVSEEDIVKAGNTAGSGLGEQILKGIKTLSFRKPKGFVGRKEFDKAKDGYLAGVAKNADPSILVVKIADRLNNATDFAKDDNPWGKEYLAKGEQFFKRVSELKNPEKIQASIEDAKKKTEEAVARNEEAKKNQAKEDAEYDDDILAWLDELLAEK